VAPAVVEVVGVAADAKYRTVGEDPQPHVYFPYQQRFTPDLTLLVRGATSTLSLEVQNAIAAIDPEVQGFFTRTLREHTRVALFPARLAAALAGLVGAISAALGAIGLYGLIACTVGERRREFGVCLALGATPSAIARGVLAQSMRLAGIGGMVGLAAALGLTQLLQSLLYGVSPIDPAIYGMVLIGVMAVAAVSSWVPARRAAGKGALAALRD
jgi:ABC-type lipoprotein release transport system permease subunit